MKKQWYYFLMMAIAALFITSCDDDDDSPVVIDVPIYGFQVTGTATGGEVYIIDQAQVAEPSSDFATKETQSGMNYGIYWLEAGDMSFSNVTVDGITTYSAANAIEVTQSAEVGGDEDAITYTAGDLVVDGTAAYSVATSGLYYIITDEVNMRFWTMSIDGFEINATGDVASIDAGGSAEGCTFSVEAVELRAAFKLRINKAWKFVFEDVPYAGATAFPDDHARPVISYGAGSADGTLAPDGGDITIDTEKLLNFTITWDPSVKGIAGITYTTEEGDELPAAEYPENMYMTGAALGTGEWSWETNAISMIPVHSNLHLFWSIQWVEIGTDVGFKFCEEKAWGKDFAITGDATDFVYAKGGDNVTVTEAGYYMIVVNLETETIEINPAPMIYGIGDAFGGWDAATAANIFTVDNTAKTIISPATTVDGNIRMHVAAATLTNAEGNAVDWWQSELSVIDGVITYRGAGDDLADVTTTVGQVATLDFVAGTGVIQ